MWRRKEPPAFDPGPAFLKLGEHLDALKAQAQDLASENSISSARGELLDALQHVHEAELSLRRAVVAVRLQRA